MVEGVLADFGEDRFLMTKLLDIEREVRRRPHADFSLPGRTVLREIINEFRAEKWPDLVKPARGRR